MTNNIKNLIENNTYLIDFERRDHIFLAHSIPTKEFYEKLCDDYELYQPYALDIQDFEDWVNDTYTAMDVLQDDTITLEDIQEQYNREILDEAIEEFFTNSEYFLWL